jgi:hypothetical protein
MDEYSNLDDVIDRVERLIDGYGFLLSVEDKALGRTCIKIVANDIQERAAHGEGSEGEWDKNAPDYTKMKERVYGVVEQPNVRTGDMLSGRALSNGTVSNEAVEMVYGTGDVASEGRTGRTVKEADKKLTDREKAYYAHTGQGPHGTTRPFYALSEDAVVAIRDTCQERLNQYVRDGLGGQGA